MIDLEVARPFWGRSVSTLGSASETIRLMPEPALCELVVKDSPCGVLAVGRCPACGRAYCTAHQATVRENFAGWQPVPGCRECLARQAEEQRLAGLALASAKAERLAKVHGEICEFVTALARRGVEPTQRIADHGEARGGWRRRTIYRVYAPAWPIGLLDWDHPESHSMSSGIQPAESGVTADGEVVPFYGTRRQEEEIERVETASRLEANVRDDYPMGDPKGGRTYDEWVQILAALRARYSQGR